MTQRFDALERSLGIAAYASDHEGFAAVLKGRFSDFVVHEVDADGNVARLDTLDYVDEEQGKEATVATKFDLNAEQKGEQGSAASHKEAGGKRKATDGADVLAEKETKIVKTCGTEEDVSSTEKTAEGSKNERSDNTDKLEKAQVELAKLVGEAAAEGAVAMLRYWQREKVDDPTSSVDDPNNRASKENEKEAKNYTLPLVSEKDKRRAIHMLVRSDLLSPFAVADTADRCVRIWHRRFQKEMPNFGHFAEDNKQGKGKRDNRQRKGDNRSTAWPRDRPDFLRFVLYKENIDTGTAARDISRFARLSRGVAYAGMKDKRGVTSQFCTVYRKEPKDLLPLNSHGVKGGAGGGNTSKGGVCVMRVGHFSYERKEVKLGMLSGNRFDIALRNVNIGEESTTCSDETGDRLAATKRLLETASLSLSQKGFINYFGMQRFGKYNDTHKVGIAVLKGDFQTAVDIIMGEKPDEADRVADARRRWSTRFAGVDIEDDQSASEAERECARGVQRDLGRFMTCEASLMSSLARKPRDYKRAFRSIAKNLRLMFLHAYQSYLWNNAATHRIESGGSSAVIVGDLVLLEDKALVLLEDKALVEGGSGTSGLKGKKVKVLTEADVQSGNFAITDVVLPLVGSKIQYPRCSTGGLFDDLMKKDGICKDYFSRMEDRELLLGGDYRKIICKPADVNFEVKCYRDPLQPLVQTDLMKVTGTEIQDDCDKSDGESNGEGRADVEGPLHQKNLLFGLVIGFTLPPSTYATIALRELMKRPTSGEYQRGLMLEGNCERNMGKKVSQSRIDNET